MKILDFLFYRYYKLFVLTKDKAPIFAATCVLGLLQGLWIMLILFLIKINTGLDFLPYSIRYVYIALIFIVTFYEYNYYRKKYHKEGFQGKLDKVGIFSIVFSLFILIIPLPIIAFTLNNYWHSIF